MSKNWVEDIAVMHSRYKVNDWVDANVDNKAKMRKFLEFRIGFLKEELNETIEAMINNDPEEIVDGLIDLCVVAIGTLDAFDVDPYKAWDQVQAANMAKVVGIKKERPNPLGLPDLVKPEGWKPPSHDDNHGFLASILS